MRCFCYELNGIYFCRKNRYFGANLGRCIEKIQKQKEYEEVPVSESAPSNFELILIQKRLKFRYFLSSLYDIFADVL